MAIGMRDERLCWVLVNDELKRRAGRYGVRGWLWIIATFGTSVHRHRGIRANRMAIYSVAVDRAANRLTAEERVVLRAQRQVPPWFLDEVQRQYRVAKRE